MMFKNKMFNILKNIITMICIIYLLYEVYKNYSYIEEKLIAYKNIFFLLIIIKIFNQNLLSLRNFSIYKICAKYQGKFNDWSQIFFESLIFNLLVSYTGSI